MNLGPTFIPLVHQHLSMTLLYLAAASLLHSFHSVVSRIGDFVILSFWYPLLYLNMAVACMMLSSNFDLNLWRILRSLVHELRTRKP